MLKKLHLVNFRSFSDFTVSFHPSGAFLVGPNNAGKSTLLTALRTADVLLRLAHRRAANFTAIDRARSITAYPLSLNAFPALRDSLRHEFGRAEARLELTWESGATLTAVWPEEEEDEDDVSAFFYLERRPGMVVRTPTAAREAFPPMGVIPILTPIEHSEVLVEPATVQRNIAGRLSSRHFRNQLRLLGDSGELQTFLDWAEPWLGDVRFDRLGQHLGEGGLVLEAFYYETGSRVPKELVWAGDGVQVWLQLLYHVYRTRQHNTLILDEPEVYLHADLQRRLVHLLEATGRQVVVATHSAEILAEADSRAVTLIDKSARRAHRAANDGDLEMLSATLGTAFNLRLARALRSRVALFVEGQDMTVLRRFAKTLGMSGLEREAGISVIQLQGYSRWGQVEPFAWLCGELLPSALKVFVILDRDYRTDRTMLEVEKSFADAGMTAHVWRRKEIESYVITPAVIVRITGASQQMIADMLSEIRAAMESAVFSRLLAERLTEEVAASRHSVTVTQAYKTEFDQAWAQADFRRDTCPPKQVIAALNSRLQAAGYKTVSVPALARAHRRDEIDAEVVAALGLVEGALS
jgi:hypothetical protein